MTQNMTAPAATDQPALRVWLSCSGCKAVLRTWIDETDHAKAWGISIASPALAQTVCPYCESNKRVRLNIHIDPEMSP